ncbi:MAG: amidophosphoribosyltransferase [Candidatus Altiarchaeota archaeon]
MREKCAVIGVKGRSDVFETLYRGLFAMQHRGQESAGIAVQNDRIRVHKDMGLISEVFRNAYLSGNIGIGHVRYSTTGESKSENAQPLLINYSKGSFAIAHNGNIVNQGELKQELESKGSIFMTTTDTELIAQLIAQEHVSRESFIESIQAVMKRLVGSYSLTILHEGRVIAVRDPSGVRPLCFGQSDDYFVVASESCALDTLNVKLVRDIKPSEILVIGDTIESYSGVKDRICHCMFEYVYFARADSVIDGIPVYEARTNLGKILAEESGVKADLVCAVPDSGITHAIGYARGSKIPYGECLMKNRYVGRTFILPEQSQRDVSTKMKLNPIRSQVDGKRIILIDDSIVRGTTTRRIVKMLKEAGAKEVHVRVASPPLKHPCRYGIDMQVSEEFIAAEKTVDEIRDVIGAKSLAYISIEGLVKAICISKDELCLACLNGDYPLREKQTKLTDE